MARKTPRKPRSKLPRGVIQYPDGHYGVDYYTPEGKRRQKKIGPRLSDAVDYHAEIQRRKAVGDVLPERKPRQRPSLSHYLTEYAATVRNQAGKLYANAWSKMVGHLQPEQLSQQQIREWIVRSEEAGLSQATIRRYLSVLSPVYTRLVREGVIGPQHNPLRDKRALGLRPLNNERVKTMHLDRLPALVEAYGPTWWPYAEFAMLNLLRFENLASLKWEDIDFDRKLAILARTKSGIKHPLQLSGRSLEILGEQRQRYPNVAWCFPAARGGKLNRNNFRNRVWLPAHEKAGLVDMHFHDLARHVPAGWLAEQGRSNYELQHSLQQTTPRMVKRYAHLRDSHMRSIMEDVASMMIMGSNGDFLET